MMGSQSLFRVKVILRFLFNIRRFDLKEKIVHQWRDWVLEYISEGKYELIERDTLLAQAIVAKTHMDAENQCQQIIKNMKGKQIQVPSNIVES